MDSKLSIISGPRDTLHSAIRGNRVVNIAGPGRVARSDSPGLRLNVIAVAVEMQIMPGPVRKPKN